MQTTKYFSRIKKEVAGIFGSLKRPKMTVKNKLSCPTLIGYLSRIKEEVAGIFGSKLSFCPKMTVKGLRQKMTEKGLRLSLP
jgi:hypothetical protein